MIAWTPSPEFSQLDHDEWSMCMVLKTMASGDILWDLKRASYPICALISSSVKWG